MSESPFPPGSVLAGKYHVDRLLGEGGMGVVLAATNAALAQKVAIKLLQPGALANPEALARFQREARAAASLKSQHVARVLDVSALEDGRPYMVMEYLEGQDLGDVIEKGPHLSIPEAVDFVLQACEAIAEAHASGIVHRDLKPRNLFLTRTVDGRPFVKVLDFGISKVANAGAMPEMQLTRTTEIIGSPSYMSPEQLRSSRNVDTRTDIWALGVILYELLTKRLPFLAETMTELVVVVVQDPEPPIRSVRDDIPSPLGDIVARCLAKRPDDRFQSVAELAMALEPFAQVGETSAAARVRAVALQSGHTLAIGSGPSSGSGASSGSWSGASSGSSSSSGAASGAAIAASGAPPASSSARINVHGGTSVSWAETSAHDVSAGMRRTTGSQDAPVVLPTKSRALPIALAVVGLVVLLVGGGGLAYRMTHDAGHAGHAGTGVVPLPPGRKDLPPVTSSDAPPPGATASSAATGLPDTRSLGPAASASASSANAHVAETTPSATPVKPASTTRPAAQTNKPAHPTTPKPPGPSPTPPPDDLSNIGRR